tara:strand:+ start:394 stop:528 length:135 start_codon:yes stop_codon:yes gene_type:complete
MTRVIIQQIFAILWLEKRENINQQFTQKKPLECVRTIYCLEEEA